MKRKSLGDMPCSIAKSLDVIGEWWTPLVLRDIHLGLHRFDELQTDLSVSRNILIDRLNTLVEGGVVERVQYKNRPPRFEYHLTRSGQELITVIAAIQEWGDRWVSPSSEPYGVAVHRHEGERHHVHAALVCDICGEVEAADARLKPGPGFVPRTELSETESVAGRQAVL